MTPKAFCCASGAALATLLGILAGCQAPTQVTLELTTDLPCDALAGTTISVGSAEDIEGAEAVTETASCKDGRIGSLVLVPAGSDEERFTVKVVGAVGVSPELCRAPAYGSDLPSNDTGCVVARRALRFLPNVPVTLRSCRAC